jgi:hypothetical protein
MSFNTSQELLFHKDGKGLTPNILQQSGVFKATTAALASVKLFWSNEK